MKHKIFSLPTYLSLACLLLLSSCGNDEQPTPAAEGPLNAFSLMLQEQLWEPSSNLNNDPCMHAYHAAWTLVSDREGNERPILTVWAYKDPKGTTDYLAENSFSLQVYSVQEPGTYTLSDRFPEDEFGSFAVFSSKADDGSYKRYVNKEKEGSFVVEIEEFLPIKSTNLKGVKGTFYGTLYNKEDPADSVVIKNGAFTFRKVNWYNFNQCPY